MPINFPIPSFVGELYTYNQITWQWSGEYWGVYSSFTDYIDFNTSVTGVTSVPGRLFWDTDNRTLSVGMLSGVTQQIGEEQYYLVENQTSGTLLDGSVVRAAGTTGSSGKILVDYMIANGTIPAFTTMGVLTQTLLSGETGYVTSFGLVRNIDTTGVPYGETWNDGDILYVSTTNLGGFTKFKPIVPNQDIIIAIVMEAAVNGSIFVRPDVYRPFKDPQLITVAKQNADFTSIKAAVDSIVGSSISNRYVIEVGPGIFVEDEIDLTSTPYVSIVGSNIQTTLIVPNTNTQHIIKIGINNEISFLSLSGASTGYAGIYCYDIGDFGQAHKVSMYDCDTNVWVESNTQDTKFYGEYLDYNGTYTYGTKVIGNNGYLALANMENYFNFPTGGNITYCNYAYGSGATLSVFVGDNQSNGISGSTAYYIYDGAELDASSITVDGFTYGIRNPNFGSPVRFDVDNASIVSGEWDLYVERIGTFGTFGGSANHEKIYTVSSDVYWLFLDIEDGELDITRKASVTFQDGSHTDFTTLIFEGGTMGLISGGSITTISGFTVQADAGFGYLEKSNNSGIVRRIDWVNNQITLSANTDNYIYINENSNLVSSGTKPITSYNILLGRVITDSTGVEFIDLSPMNAQHTSNSFDSLFTMALGPIYATGSIVTEGITPFTLDVSQGDYHFSTNVFLPSGGTNITFTQYYRNGTGSTWVTSATTLVNNTQYDNNGTLTGLTAGYFTKHTLYTVGQGSYENYFLVLGQNEYSTLVEAEDALLPTPPTYFSDGVVQIANIYIEQGSSGITQVEDIRPTIGFRAGGVNASSVHGNLLGLAADDHIQYLLVSGARAMSGNLDMGANDITNVGTVDGVTVSAHAARHQFGGLDPVGSVTPSANAIPYADVSGTLNDWVSTASTTTFGKVKTTSSSTTVVSDNDLRFLNSFTGGTYSGGTISFTNNSGGTYNVTGLFTGGTDVFVTGATYSNNTFTYTNNTGGTFNVNFNTVTGLTVNGDLSVTGTTSSGTISATTYQNLPDNVTGRYLPLSGGTVTGGTIFQSGLTANTISATTYVNYPTQDLSTTLGYGNSSGNKNISMGTTTSIISDNTGGQIDLDFGGNAGSIKITTDSGSASESFIKMTSIDSEFGYSNSSFGIATSYTKINATNRFYIDNLFNSSPSQEVILIDDNASTNITSSSGFKSGVIIGSASSRINSGIRNVVIVGGESITATSNNTLYTYNFNIFGTPAGNNSNTQILSRNASTGNVEIITLSYITGLTSGDTFVTGFTYSNNNLTINQNQGQNPLSVNISTMTGLTVNGNLSVTGTTSSGTISATTYQNLPTLRMKSDSVAAGSFAGNPKKYTVTFTTPYPNTSYTIGITGSDNRGFTYESKATTGFVINTNANTALTGNVDWQTIAIGES